MISALGNVAMTSLAEGIGRAVLERSSAMEPGASASAGAADYSGESFGATLARMGTDMVEDLRHGEEMSVAGIRGEAKTRDVVDAVLTAEQSLQTALALRDKIVAAYLEVSRMAI